MQGNARAATAYALDYAKGRRQTGRPIIEHQSVKSRIFEMYRQVECARALNLNVVMLNASSSEWTAIEVEPLQKREATDLIRVFLAEFSKQLGQSWMSG